MKTIRVIAAAILVSQVSFAAHAAQLFTPIPTTNVSGKACLKLDHGVWCKGEGPKCVPLNNGNMTPITDRSISGPTPSC